MMACEHAWGSTTGCARDSSLWNRTFVEDVCSIGPLLFNVFFAPVIDVANMRFKAGKDILDALVHLGKKTGVGGRG